MTDSKTAAPGGDLIYAGMQANGRRKTLLDAGLTRVCLTCVNGLGSLDVTTAVVGVDTLSKIQLILETEEVT